MWTDPERRDQARYSARNLLYRSARLSRQYRVHQATGLLSPQRPHLRWPARTRIDFDGREAGTGTRAGKPGVAARELSTRRHYETAPARELPARSTSARSFDGLQ